MITSGIYSITNLENGKIYIGSTVDFDGRWKGHRYDLCKGVHHNLHLQSSWNKHGEDTFKFMICEYVNNHEQLIDREQYWLDFHRMYVDVYNIALVVDKPSMSKEVRRKISRAKMGHSVSEETRRKLSEFFKDKPGIWLGKHLSEDHKHNISESLVGRKLSEEHKSKIGKSSTGRKLTEESKRSMSEAQRNMSPEAKAEKARKCREAMMGKKNALGYKHSEEGKRKMRIAWKTRPPVSDETRRKQSESAKARCARRRNNG